MELERFQWFKNLKGKATKNAWESEMQASK